MPPRSPKTHPPSSFFLVRYTYLNQKYGLKKLIIEHATSIVKAMRRFQTVSNPVLVFAKIYGNAIDEEFRNVQEKLKITVEDLLRVYIKGKHPLKSDDVINRLLVRATGSANAAGAGVVSEEQWTDIVRYMYNEQDAVKLGALVKEAIRALPPVSVENLAIGSARSAKMAAPAVAQISYVQFVAILLDFQLRGHDAFLAKFRDVFRSIDQAGKGYLDEVQFTKVRKNDTREERGSFALLTHTHTHILTLPLSPPPPLSSSLHTTQLVTTIDLSKTEASMTQLLESVDPWNNQKVTYSECVEALSDELVSMSRNL